MCKGCVCVVVGHFVRRRVRTCVVRSRVRASIVSGERGSSRGLCEVWCEGLCEQGCASRVEGYARVGLCVWVFGVVGFVVGGCARAVRGCATSDTGCGSSVVRRGCCVSAGSRLPVIFAGKFSGIKPNMYNMILY